MASIAWRDFDLVRLQLKEARDCVRAMVAVPADCPIERALDEYSVESPIEAVFLIWLEVLFIYGGQIGNRAFVALSQRSVKVDGELFRPDFIIVPSDRILLELGGLLGCEMKLAVELDGHDFHERTKEQVALRDRRDRVLQRHGWIVLHISGSELVKTQTQALKDVWLCAEAQMKRIREAVAKDWGIDLSYKNYGRESALKA